MHCFIGLCPLLNRGNRKQELPGLLGEQATHRVVFDFARLDWEFLVGSAEVAML